MNLSPPPITDNITELRTWCESLYKFLEFPVFPGSIETGGFVGGLVTKTGNYTVTAADYTIICDATSGSFTITLLPVASQINRICHIKKIDSSANTITIDGDASETIDDATTAVLTTQYESITIQSDGSEWWII